MAHDCDKLPSLPFWKESNVIKKPPYFYDRSYSIYIYRSFPSGYKGL